MKILLGNINSKSVNILFAFKDRLQDEARDGIQIKQQMGGKAEITWHYGRNGESNLLVVGLGEAAKLNMETIRMAAGNAGRAVEKEKVNTNKSALTLFHSKELSMNLIR